MNISGDLALKVSKTELDGSGYNGKYIKTIKKSQSNFLNWALQNNITDLSLVTKKDLLNYQKHLLEIVSMQTGKPLANGTLADRYNAVKILFASLFRTGILKDDITSGIDFELPKREGLKRQAFTENEMSDILDFIDINSEIGLRDRALFELVYSSGIRVSEASNLRIKDICFERREMIVRGKFARDRIVPFTNIASDYVKLYLNERILDKEAPVFCPIYRNKEESLRPESISRRFNDLLRKREKKKAYLSAHSIRHSTASVLLDNGAGLRHVQELLGHINPETTAKYLHTHGKRLAMIYKKHHPQEHDLYDAVDGVYKNRLKLLLERDDVV